MPVGTGIDETRQCAPPSEVTMTSASSLAGAPDGALPMRAHISAVEHEN